MANRIIYVLGGPLQPDIETRKRDGAQPLAEFNVFAARNGATIAGTDQVAGGDPTSLRRRLALAQLLSRRRTQYDALLASGEDVGLPLALSSLANRVGKPIWIVLHGSYLEGAKFRLVAPVLRRARRVHFLCLSETLRRRMIDVLGFPAARCHNAGYGVDTTFFRPAAPSDERLLGAAGSANRDYRTLGAAL